MSVNLKQFEKHLKRIKERLKKGDIFELLELMKNISSIQEFDMLREQKILLKIHEPEKQLQLVRAYKTAAKEVMGESTLIHQSEMYADFTLVAIKRFRKLSNTVSRCRNTIKLTSQITLIEVIEEILESELNDFMKLHRAVMEKQLHVGNSLSAPTASDLTEYLVRKGSETSINLAYDAARLLNTLSPFSSNRNTTNRAKRVFSVKNKLKELIYIAHEWNLIEWIIDKLTYGEWIIQELNITDSVKVVFDIPDKDLYLAKTIALRRSSLKPYFKHVFSISSPEESKLLKKWFKRQLVSFFNEGINFYIRSFTSSSGLPDSLNYEYEQSKKQMLILLDVLGPNDELLLAASAKDESSRKLVMSHYLSAVALPCMKMAADFVERHFRKQVKLTYLPIPIDSIKALVKEAVGSPELAEKALNSYLTELPTLSFLDISKKPFVRIADNHVIGLKNFGFLNWNMSVHSNIMQGGNMGTSYGELLEISIEELLIEYGWFTKRGIKVKENGRLLTDADLIAIKGDLLLAIQMKAIATSGDTIYEHWKARNIILKGAEQAEIVGEKLISDVPWRESLVPKEIRGKIEKIQPLVLTNYPLLTGWKFKDIPIISVGYLNSLLKGAKVKYMKPGDIVEDTKRFVEGEELSSEELIQFIKGEPTDWKIATESNEVIHNALEIDRMSILIPELRRNSEVDFNPS